MLLRRLMVALALLTVAAVTLPSAGQDQKDTAKPAPKPADTAKPKDTAKPQDTAKPAEKPPEKAPDKPAPTNEKTLLKWKFEKDKPFYQKMTTKTEQTMTVGTNPVTQKQSQTFYFAWKPLKMDGDSWDIEQTIEGVTMDINIGGSQIAYDSTKEGNTNNPLGEFFKALVGSKFVITLDTKSMKVTKITGHKEFVDKLVAANPQMQPLLKQILSESALKEMAEPTFAAIPGKEVVKGDKWKKETTLDMGPIGKYNNTYEYIFEGKEDKLDKIKVEMALKYVPPAEGAATGGLPFRIKSADLKSTSAGGAIYFDAAKGRVEKSNMKIELTGTLSIEIGGLATPVDLKQTQTTDVEAGDASLVPVVKKG